MARKAAHRGQLDQPTLLEHAVSAGRASLGNRPPLAERMRPQSLDEILGQAHLLGPGKWLRRAIESDRFPSLLLWGPPGVGKTTLASVIAQVTRRNFAPFSAVLGGVAELRALLSEAEENRRYRGRGTVLFIDEIHRFNRTQQDAFLPHVERGTVTLIGATTENPSFAVNAALLSRSKVLALQPLTPDDIVPLLARALSDDKRGLGELALSATPAALAAIAHAAHGDARRALGLLETAALLQDAGRSEPEPSAPRPPQPGAETPNASGESQPGATARTATPPTETLTEDSLSELLSDTTLFYDKSGEEHYNVISAFIKSMRGSDPDAAIYWLMRMLDAGEDPLFVLRRMIIFASEDVGNADPRALPLVVAADQAFLRMGMPEGYYPIAHACLYLASCPKSGAVGAAFHGARAEIERSAALPVPKKLRNAASRLMKDHGYGDGYRHAHDFSEGFAPGETYLPDEIVGTKFYRPTEHGLEKAIRERLERIDQVRPKRPLPDEE